MPSYLKFVYYTLIFHGSWMFLPVDFYVLVTCVTSSAVPVIHDSLLVRVVVVVGMKVSAHVWLLAWVQELVV